MLFRSTPRALSRLSPTKILNRQPSSTALEPQRQGCRTTSSRARCVLLLVSGEPPGRVLRLPLSLVPPLQAHGLEEPTIVQCPYTSSNCPLFNPIFTEADVANPSLPHQSLPPSQPSSSVGYSQYSIAPGPNAAVYTNGGSGQRYTSGSLNSLVSLANAVNSPEGDRKSVV